MTAIMRDLRTNSWGYRYRGRIAAPLDDPQLLQGEGLGDTGAMAKTEKRDALKAQIAAYDNARDGGRLYFANFPELMLVEVSREGSKRFKSQNEVVGFLQGYIEARAQRDAYSRGE